MSLSVEPWTENDDLAIRYSRDLAVRILSEAKSGHPGATLSLMPVFYSLYSRIMSHNPGDPSWAARDRLIVSCGHASLAQYIQLHLSGYPITEEDLFRFRTLGSITPGHPEFGVTPGVEVSSGPLGQGFAMGVGVALSQKLNPKTSLGNGQKTPRTYIVLSDGDVQEGITLEAASLASIYALDNLVAIYDSNGISIDGEISSPKGGDTRTIFEGHGWNVRSVGKLASGDVNTEALCEVLSKPIANNCPTLVIVETEIGWPAPNWKGKAVIHGNLLSEEESALTRSILDIGDTNKDHTERAVQEHYKKLIRPKLDFVKGDKKLIDDFQNSGLKVELASMSFPENISARKANGMIIEQLQSINRLIIGGSADLTESNSLSLKNQYQPETESAKGIPGSNLRFGVREHAMTAIINGLALDRDILPFCATYLVFSDYQKPAIRLAALMNLPSVFIWTHDSIAIGADGPTHQPIEHLAMLRAIPNFIVARPATAEELRVIWEAILERQGPIGLVLSRQELPNPQAKKVIARNAKYGAYVYHENFSEGLPEVIIIATGSELHLAYEASIEPDLAHLKIRVVSMPSQEIFLSQPSEYRESVLPSLVTNRVSVEAASIFGWSAFVGNGNSIGIDRFGMSAPGDELLEFFQFTVERIINHIARGF